MTETLFEPLLIEPLLTTEDMMKIFLISRTTVYRRDQIGKEQLAKGEPSPHPVSIGNTKKQGLRWRREDVLAYLSANNPQSARNIESVSQRKKRHAAACESLRRHGVKINNSNKRKEQ